MLPAITHKNWKYSISYNVEMPVCGPRLDEKSFFHFRLFAGKQLSGL